MRFPEYTFLRHARAKSAWGGIAGGHAAGRAPLVPRIGNRAAGQSAARPGTWRPTASAGHHSEGAFASAEPVRSCESLRSVVLPDTTIDAAVDRSGRRADRSVLPRHRHRDASARRRSHQGLHRAAAEELERPVPGHRRRRLLRRDRERLRQPLAAGYAAGATDTGHEGGSGSFALDASGRLNWHAIRDNAYLGIHEMTVTGKALTAGVLRQGAALRLLQRMFDRRPPGFVRGAALPCRLRRDSLRRSGDQLAEAPRRAAVGARS